MGVDRAYVSGLELGQRNPTVLTLWQVAEALGVKLHQFFEENTAGLGAATDKPRASPRGLTLPPSALLWAQDLGEDEHFRSKSDARLTRANN
jgi:transcriptional regulator with XRE-family HTH domain